MKNAVSTNNARTITFKNATLQKYIENIDKAVLLGKRSALTIAENVVSIYDKDCWHDDFANDKDLASYLGVSAQMLCQYKGAVEYNKTNPNAKKLGYSVRRSYELGKLQKADKLNDFYSYCQKKKLDTGTDAKLLDAIAGFSGKLTKAEKKAAKDAEIVSVKESATAVDNELEGAVKVVTIEYNDIIFSIPVKEMEKLIKKYHKS